MNGKIQLALWISQPVLELLLTAVLIWRKLYRKFPVFVAYLISQITGFAVLFPIHEHGSYQLDFYSYWISAVVCLAIGFKVIHEIFLDVFRPYRTLKDLGTVLFKWATLVMIFVALVVAVSSRGEQSPIVLVVFTIGRCVRVIQCGLVLFLLVFSEYVGVSWRRHSFGIALGFGLFASAELAGSALYVGGKISESTMGLLDTVSYSCTILLWLGYALIKEDSVQLTQAPAVSQRWEQSLTDLQHPAPAVALIPMFEQMVDRAFSRSGADADSDPLNYRVPFNYRVEEDPATHKFVAPRSFPPLVRR